MTFLPVIELGMPYRSILRIKKGAPVSLTFEFTEPEEPFTPHDYRGKEFLAQIRSSPGGTLMATFDVNTDDAINGVIVLSLTKEQVADLRRGFWEFEVDGKAEFSGPFEIEEEISYV